MSRAQPFGNYDLLERVNVGGMAEIFRAVDRKSGGIVAIKRILPELNEDEEFVRMFRDEAKVASALDHPSIAKILDLGRVDSTYFLALEFVEGLDLRGIFERAAKADKKLPLGFLLHVFLRVCEGLAYAHKKTDERGRPMHLVHRDVSLQNVIVAFDGDVKLIDFGIAKSAGKLSKTQVGTIKGKYAYMSPEQVRGLRLDHRSDLFSLGICMHEMLTLKRLFGTDNEMLIMERIKDGDVPSPRETDPEIPYEIDRIVMRALATDVDERYPSADDLASEIQSFATAQRLTWGRAEIAEYMRRSFDADFVPSPPREAMNGPSSKDAVTQTARVSQPPPSPPSPHRLPPAAPRLQESIMSEEKGSDLDVFEGLSSKRADARRPSVAPPPPPPSRSMPPPPAPPARRGTQLGMGSLPAGGSVAPLPPPPRTSTPPVGPPPGRGPTSAPPPKSTGNALAAPKAAPPPPSPKAEQQGPRGAAVEMDWDDEDEKTHIYDNVAMKDAMRSSTSVATAMPAPPPPAPMTALPAPLPPPPSGLPVSSNPTPGALGGSTAFKGTMVGLGAPLPPPPSRAAGAGSERPLPPPPSRPSQFGNGALPLPPPTSPNPFAQTAVAVQTPMPMMSPLAATAPMVSSVPTPGPIPSTSGRPQFGNTPVPMMSPFGAAPAAAPMSTPQYMPPVEAAPPRAIEATQIVRPQRSDRMGLYVGLGSLALILACATGYWMTTRPGAIVVNVEVKGAKDADVKVTLDSEAKKCEGGECRIDGVRPGVHSLKATTGDVEKRLSVSVEPGKDAVANLTLEVEAKTSTLKVAKLAQSGVQVAIDDGKPQDLPYSNDDLKPGKHTLKFTGGDAFAAKEMNVDLDEGATKTIDDVKLSPKSVKVTFALPTKGEKAQLTDGKKSIDLTDGATQTLDTSSAWTVNATAPGCDDLAMPVKLGDDTTQKVSVEPSPKSAATAPTTTAATPTPASTPTPRYTPPPSTPTPTPTPTPPAVSAAGDGSLFINTLPKSNCVVNGTPRGSTPMTLKLAPGSYSVTCVAKDGDDTLKKSGSATVSAGDTAKLILKLRD